MGLESRCQAARRQRKAARAASCRSDHENERALHLFGGLVHRRAFRFNANTGSRPVSLRHRGVGHASGRVHRRCLLAERTACGRSRFCAGARRPFCRWTRAAASLSGQQLHLRKLFSRRAALFSGSARKFLKPISVPFSEKGCTSFSGIDVRGVLVETRRHLELRQREGPV